MRKSTHEITRRQLLGAGAAGVGVGLPLVLAPSVLSAADEPTSGDATATSDSASTVAGATAPPAQAKPDYVFNIKSKTIAPFGVPTAATLVNGKLPGPEIRYHQGDMFRVLVNNRLPVPTTLHWHGMIVPNFMDGVPGVTQMPIQPGDSVLYEYPLRQNGTYWYHSHYQFQEQTGQGGPFVIEARNEPHQYDHDVVVFLSDWLNQPPEGIIPQIRGEQPATEVIKPPEPVGYTFPGDKPFKIDVNYHGYLMNGRPNENPWTLKVRRGDRLRLRFINGSTATFFRVALDGHPMQLIAADGQPVVPLSIDNFVIATAERYDVLVTIQESGSFTLHAAALGTHRQAVGVVHTADTQPKANLARPTFSGKSGGMADYAALKSPYPTTLPEGPVKTFDIVLGGEMKKYLWSMSGEYYPETFSPDGKATPLAIQRGDRVRLRFSNKTMMFHPMHLHGHFFRLLPAPDAWDDATAPLKGTLGVGPMQRIDVEFTADNPGNWFFHCHNLYHLASGMARVVRYDV